MRAFARWEDPRGGDAPVIPSRGSVRLCAFDLETHLAQPGLAAPPIVVASVANGRGAFLLDPTQALAWLRKTLADPTAHIVGCNIAYDMVCAAAADPELVPAIFVAYDAGRIHDVAIRQALIDIRNGELVEHGDEDNIGIRYGMTLLAKRHLNLDLAEDKKGKDAWRKRYALLEGMPIEQWPWKARAYPMRDVALPLSIFERQEGGPNLHREADECRAALALELMRVWGVRMNGEAVAALRARVEAEDLRNTIKFREAGILRADGTENKKHLQDLVTKAYNGNPPLTAPSKKFPRGQVATDRDTLTESGNATLELYGRAGRNDKYLTTYLPILEQGIDQPWNPQFNVLVATTRVSSNAQQFPQLGGVRECIEARPGHVFCSVDYGGLELRTMSQRAIWAVGYSLMAEALNSGKDPHIIAAASFMGLVYDECLRRYKAGDELVKIFRDLGKIWNFGKGGGMGPAAMVFNARKGSKGETTTAPDGTVYIGARFCILTKTATRCGVERVTAKVQGKERRICAACLEAARKLDAGWLKAWTEQRDLFALASKLSKASRYIDATIPVVNVTRGKCGYTQFLNTPFQGLGAAATKRAMWLISREMYTDRTSPLWGSRLVLNVHDELIGEHPEDRAPEAGDRLAFIMRETLKQVVPDLAPSVEADPALSRTMAKGAKTVRNAAGRLQVWEPVAKAA